MPTIAVACARLMAENLPVLFVDTCSLVDPIRTLMRPQQLHDCVRAALALNALASTERPKVKLVVASLVPGEWQTHADPTVKLLREHLAGMDKQAADFHSTCNLLGITPGFAAPSYDSIGLADRLHHLSHQILHCALTLEPQDDTGKRAYDRALRRIPPSKKGGGLEDCTILEECLEVSRQLRASEFLRPLVFCTSNTKDYCEGRQLLHPALSHDFDSVRLIFATNFASAVNKLMA